MDIQRLPWAGIRVLTGTTTIVIDPISRIPQKFGQSLEPMYPLDQFGNMDAVFITHLHDDHFDPDAIIQAYGASIPVYVPEEMAEAAKASGLKKIIGAKIGVPYEIGADVTATAVPSVDGVGDIQVAWVIKGEGRTLIHCGDTLWHGYWWNIAKSYGPFDAACLPVNGAVLELPGRIPSAQPICLTPEQAVSAASVLQSGTLIPIHYGAIHHPPIYNETADIINRLTTAANGKVKLEILKALESITL